MGFLMEYLKKRYAEKKWLYVLDWVFDILLAAAFIYLSLSVRQQILTCTCPNPFNSTTLLNITLNLTNITEPTYALHTSELTGV